VDQQEVGLHRIGARHDDADRRSSHHGDAGFVEWNSNALNQAKHGVLVKKPRRRRPVEHSIDDLVAVAVVG
jgi:hypothetical protein